MQKFTLIVELAHLLQDPMQAPPLKALPPHIVACFSLDTHGTLGAYESSFEDPAYLPMAMPDGNSEAPQQSHNITTTPQQHEVLFEQHSQEYKALTVFCHTTYGLMEVPSPQVIIHSCFERAGKCYVGTDKFVAQNKNHNRFIPACFQASWEGDWKPKPDSQVMVMVAHDATPCPWPGVISSIFVHRHLVNGKPTVETLAVLRLRKVYKGQDPWQEFPHLQASLWSNEFEELQVMKMERILCHYASCKVSSEQCVVISLDLVSDLPSMDMHKLSGLGRNEYFPSCCE